MIKDDLISRPALFEALKKSCPVDPDINAVILAQPSVTPARPKGKWIPIKADCRGYTFTFECSECHGYSYEDTYTIECEYDWCPRCGADMRGGEEDADN